MPRIIVLSPIAAHVLAVVAVVVVIGWTHHKPRPCLKTFERVQVGMTLAEVEAIVGAPPGNYSSSDDLPALLYKFRHTDDVVWVCDEVELNVLCAEGRAQEVWVGPSNLNFPPSRVERLWAWVITGYDHSGLRWSMCMPPGPHDLDGLRFILNP